jgi:hypothetical protein
LALVYSNIPEYEEKLYATCGAAQSRDTGSSLLLCLTGTHSYFEASDVTGFLTAADDFSQALVISPTSFLASYGVAVVYDRLATSKVKGRKGCRSSYLEQARYYYTHTLKLETYYKGETATVTAAIRKRLALLKTYNFDKDLPEPGFVSNSGDWFELYIRRWKPEHCKLLPIDRFDAYDPALAACMRDAIEEEKRRQSTAPVNTSAQRTSHKPKARKRRGCKTRKTVNRELSILLHALRGDQASTTPIPKIREELVAHFQEVLKSTGSINKELGRALYFLGETEESLMTFRSWTATKTGEQDGNGSIPNTGTCDLDG